MDNKTTGQRIRHAHWDEIESGSDKLETQMEVEMRGLIKTIAAVTVFYLTAETVVHAQSTDAENPYEVFESLDGVASVDPFAGGLGATPLTPLEILTQNPNDPLDNSVPGVDLPSSDGPSQSPEDPIILFPEPPNPTITTNTPSECAHSDCLGLEISDSNANHNSAEVPLPASVILLLSGLVGGAMIKQKSQNTSSTKTQH